MKKALIVVLIITGGVIVRIFLAAHAYPSLIWDARTYVDYAQEFLRGNLPIEPRTKNMGYPLFLALMFWIRNGADLTFVKIIQILLDLLAGILVAAAARKIFSTKIALIALILYMLNPFTSSYVGLMLPEAYSCFLIGILLAITTSPKFNKNVYIWFLTGLILGLLLFARYSLLLFAAGSIGVLSLFCLKRSVAWKFLLISLAGFLLASSYSLVINYKTYGRISFTPPYTTLGGQIYLTMFYANRYPEVVFWGVSSEEARVYEEYRLTPLSELSNWNKHYLNLFITKLINEPLTFIVHYIRNLFWLWDKDHLFTYRDPWYPDDRYPLRVLNLIFLGLSILGIAEYLRRDRNRALHKPFVVLTLILGLVMSLQFPLVSNENRHTIPFYPLLFFWAAYGMEILLNLNKKQ